MFRIQEHLWFKFLLLKCSKHSHTFKIILTVVVRPRVYLMVSSGSSCKIGWTTPALQGSVYEENSVRLEASTPHDQWDSERGMGDWEKTRCLRKGKTGLVGCGPLMERRGPDAQVYLYIGKRGWGMARSKVQGRTICAVVNREDAGGLTHCWCASDLEVSLFYSWPLAVHIPGPGFSLVLRSSQSFGSAALHRSMWIKI